MSVYSCKNAHEMRFLVVDDSTSMRRIIIRTLKELGCTDILEAASANAALPILDQLEIDFIVCDWNMPGMKGIDLLRKVRSTEKLKNLPFLMVSAESNTEMMLEAIQCGVSNYLPKPFKPEILRKKIEVILDAQRTLCANGL
jgi:two-component system, chemotaxis family, chemotaxis protein CheY